MERKDVDIAKGTSSLQKLRTARAQRPEDAFAIVALGQTLAAFELLGDCTASGLILRFSLEEIKGWYVQLALDEEKDPVIITSILWDSVQCLLRREVPVVRFVESEKGVVDRMAGLCTSLLPVLYDLCVVGNSLKCGFGIDVDELGRIEQRLLDWEPQRPTDFASTFSNQEVLGMDVQARMYRLAGLLIIHRLLNPIGTRDDVASNYASSILVELSAYAASVGPGKSLPNVAFPILMAAFEIPEIQTEVWESMAMLHVASVCAAKMMTAVEHAWKERRHGFRGCIFDLVDRGPKFIVVP